jgi:hypothetical protein
MAAGARERARRGVRRTRGHGINSQGNDEDGGSHDACGIHLRVSRMLPVSIVLLL